MAAQSKKKDKGEKLIKERGGESIKKEKERVN